jgi:ABC-type branched-subunit amino acid transport system substrate-binding protein
MLSIAELNNRRTPMLGDMANLYEKRTLDDGKFTQGMTLVPAWNIDAAQNTEFVRKIRQNTYWDGKDVNPSAALSYSALKSLAKAIEQVSTSGSNLTSVEIAKTLVSPDFYVDGAFNIPIQFSDMTRASSAEIQFVKVCPISGNYKFIPINESESSCPSQ